MKVVLLLPLLFSTLFGWQLGHFKRADHSNPILFPLRTTFLCPIQHVDVRWECEHTFNPAAVVRNGVVYLIYRAEDDFGEGIGKHTSRLGLATSLDGLHFKRHSTPVLYPDEDEQKDYEWPGGVEDPRIVETEEGKYVMTYTQWNRQIAALAVATSEDLYHWQKHGYAFESISKRRWSKSGSIVCRLEGDRLIATKINGKYWMYWGEGNIGIATSDDLISWEPFFDDDGKPLAVLIPREGKFDSALVEPGPPALLTPQGILLLYNGKNSTTDGDPEIPAKAYSAGQVLFDLKNPTRILARTEECFLTPSRWYEMDGQYEAGTVFIEGLVHFKNKWFLYYGSSDSEIGVAVAPGN